MAGISIEEDHENEKQGAAAGLGGDAREAARPSPTGHAPDEHMALSVTRHAGISRQGIDGPREFRFLSAAIDTLDVGLFVEWGSDWDQLYDELEAFKKRAEGTEGILFSRSVGGFKSKMFAGGKRPMYRFHLETSVGHLFIGKSSIDKRKFRAKGTPNVRIEISSEAIYLNGPEGSMAYVQEAIESLGGRILAYLISRVDLCVDMLLSEPLTIGFLDSHIVCRSSEFEHIGKDGCLETYYRGAKKAPLQVRFYDKFKEIEQNPAKLFMWSVWTLKPTPGVWRTEFQMRRPALKQFGVNSLEDLLSKAASIWAHLTESWISVRHLDSDNTARRTVHPWWRAVQAAAEALGDPKPIKRDYSLEGDAPVLWYINHISGCLVSYAARKGLDDLETAWRELGEDIKRSTAGRSFNERYELKAMELGRKIPANSEAGVRIEQAYGINLDIGTIGTNGTIEKGGGHAE